MQAARHLVTSGFSGHAHRQNSFVLFFRSPSTSASGQAQKQQVSLRPTDRPPAKANISLFGDRLLRGHSPIEINNTSDAMSSEKLSF